MSLDRAGACVVAALLLATVTIATATPDTRPRSHEPEHVIVLHGLARTPRAMLPLAERLGKAGFTVHNVGYPSREKDAAALVGHIVKAVEHCRQRNAKRIHFVTHSLGGILVRAYLASNRPEELGRVVMLAPPNGGSQIVDTLGDVRLFELALGPIAQRLGTSADGLPRSLGPAEFDVGVIAGNASINPLGSWLLPGEDDGAVSVEATKLEGMRDFIVVPHTHTFMMRSDTVAEQTVHYLENGSFLAEAAESPPTR